MAFAKKKEKVLTISVFLFIILRHGLVAQLGAHHIRIVGVGSSNLLKSTK